MAYKKGEVKYGQTWNSDKDFYLPHSCDEWIIGTKENAEQLIQDLQELIATLPNEIEKEIE